MPMDYETVGVFYQAWNATFASFFQEMFPTRTRVTGFAISQNIGLAVVAFLPTVFTIVAPPGSTNVLDHRRLLRHRSSAPSPPGRQGDAPRLNVSVSRTPSRRPGRVNGSAPPPWRTREKNVPWHTRHRHHHERRIGPDGLAPRAVILAIATRGTVAWQRRVTGRRCWSGAASKAAELAHAMTSLTIPPIHGIAPGWEIYADFLVTKARAAVRKAIAAARRSTEKLPPRADEALNRRRPRRGVRTVSC